MFADAVGARRSRRISTYVGLAFVMGAVVSCRSGHFVPTVHRYQAQAQIQTFFAGLHSDVPWNWDIFEYNDTQPIGNVSGDYGPVVSIFAAPDLGTIDNSAFAPPDGHLVAIVHVDDTPPTLPGSYSAVGLHSGFNCMFLVHTGADPNTGWSGYVTPTAVGQNCPSGTNAAGRMDLAAIHTVYPEAPNADDYPAVARLEETKSSGMAFGVRCAAAWCELGVTATSELAQNEQVGDANESPSARSRVPGWFDSQRVAVPVGTFKQHLVAKMRASVMPTVELGQWTKADYAADTVGKRVARVFIKGPIDVNYRNAGLEQGWSDLLLRYDTPTSQYEARIQQSATKQGPWLVVKFTDHTGKAVPRTARWAWEPWDEGIWVGCDVGCCEVEAQSIS